MIFFPCLMQSLVSLVFLNISNYLLAVYKIMFLFAVWVAMQVVCHYIGITKGEQAGCSCRLKLKLHELLGTDCLYNCGSSSSSPHCTLYSGLWVQDKYCLQKDRSRSRFVFEKKPNRTIRAGKTSAGYFFSSVFSKGITKIHMASWSFCCK